MRTPHDKLARVYIAKCNKELAWTHNSFYRFGVSRDVCFVRFCLFMSLEFARNSMCTRTISSTRVVSVLGLRHINYIIYLHTRVIEKHTLCSCTFSNTKSHIERCKCNHGFGTHLGTWMICELPQTHTTVVCSTP